MGLFYEGCAEQLILHVRHRAWLAAVPDKIEGENRKPGAIARGTTLQNKANLGANVPELELPPIDGAAHLVDHLFDIGPAIGGEAITFQEIAAWSDLTGHVLTSWEASMLRRLSVAFLDELHQARAPDRLPPYTPDA